MRPLLAFALLLALSAPAAHAQFESRWLNIGEMQHHYHGGGAEYETFGDFGKFTWWPLLTSRPASTRAMGLWIGARDVRGPEGETFPYRVVHVGPRVSGAGEFFPLEFKQVSRFEPPEVAVDGFDTFLNFSFNDEVDEGIDGDRLVYTQNASLLGLEAERVARQSSNEHHDNYHLIEYTFTNTGNTDADEEIELPDQTLEDVYITYLYRRDMWIQHRLVTGGWSVDMMYDEVGIGSGMDDVETDFRAVYSWQGHHVQQENPDPLGVPIAGRLETQFLPAGDTLGRLAAPAFVGTLTLHADDQAYPAGTGLDQRQDDASQPSATGWSSADLDLMSGNDPFNETRMQAEYQFMAQEHMVPHHADVVDLDGDFTTPDQRPDLNLPGGVQGWITYGPYTIPPGESVRIVLAEAVAGISLEAASQVGQQFKASGFDDGAPLEYDGVAMTKDEWVLSSRDSLFQTFRRARANFESGYAIPEAPLPPSRFSVTSGVDRITLEWDVYPGASPTGFEVYRARNQFAGDAAKDFQYDLVATLGPGERRYEDADAERGIQYYYYVQAVGDVNADDTGMTPTGVPLKSNRYWTQTYDPAVLKREAGSLSAARVVPNPYNVSASEDVRYPGEVPEIRFLNIPGQSTIRIYSQIGELVRTIEHDDGSGDEAWNLSTDANQVIVSGIYLAVIRDDTSGEQTILKFSVIR